MELQAERTHTIKMGDYESVKVSLKVILKPEDFENGDELGLDDLAQLASVALDNAMATELERAAKSAPGGSHAHNYYDD